VFYPSQFQINIPPQEKSISMKFVKIYFNAILSY
jgi:hypothetical protein